MKGIPKGVSIPNVTPLSKQILVYLEADADKFSAAPTLVKPDAVKSDHVFRIGRVVKTGPGGWSKKGHNRMPIGIDIGSRVLFVKFVATNTKTAESIQHTLGKDFALLRESDLLLELDECVKMEDIGQ